MAVHRTFLHLALASLLMLEAPALAQTVNLSELNSLQHQLDRLTTGDGRIGVCAEDVLKFSVCSNGNQRFSMQSVVKLIVAAAAMDMVDRKAWRLDEPVTVRRENLSLYVQPIAKRVAAKGEVRTTIGELIRDAVVASDSAATDILIERMGGPQAIQSFLTRHGLAESVRVDRNERDLQTEIAGLTWKPEYVDAHVLELAEKRVPEVQRERAFRAYLKEERDTATPRGMTSFLAKLAAGELLSQASSAHLLGIMRRTATFPDRLRAGTPEGWTIAHKTGTGPTLNGLNSVTNDVGVLTAPSGGWVAISVFVAESRRPSKERAAVIARAAQVIAGGLR